MNIDGINTGYVLDHIKAGKGFELYHLLGLDKVDCTVAIIQRASSEKYGRTSSRSMPTSLSITT